MEGIYIKVNAKTPGADNSVQPVAMEFCQSCQIGLNTPEAYERLIHDAVRGDSTYFTRWDEVAQAWEFVDKIAQAWGEDKKDLGAPDGYTLLMGISSIAINPHTQSKVPYDPVKDFAPISQVVKVPLILASHPSLPPRNLKQLIAFVRARPGQLNYGTGSVGSNPHLAMELFLATTGLKAVHVPYRGQGPALIDFIGGHLELMMANLLAVLPHYQANRVIAHGVSSAKRSEVVPQVPTIAEAGVPGYEVVQWFGVLAPAGTPRPIVDKLHAAIVRALQDPNVKKGFSSQGADTVGSTPEQLGAIIRSDLQRWGALVKKAGIMPDTR
jgi:tripartite-type tricarboxylate transporter receptor subunit TctC